MSMHSSSERFAHDGTHHPVRRTDISSSDRPARQPGPLASLFADLDAALAAVHGDEGRDEMAALATLAHVTAALSGHIVTVGAGQRTAAILGGAARAAGRSRVFAIDLFPDSDESPDDSALSLDDFLGTMTRSELLEYVL